MKFVAVLLVALCALAATASAESPSETAFNKCLENPCSQEEISALVVGIIGPPLAGFVICLLAIPCFLCGRFCCNCCGGISPSPNFCCGNPRAEGDMYSISAVRILKLAVIVALVFGIIFMSVGAAGNARVTKGVNGFMQALVDFTHELSTRIDKVITDLESMPYTYSSDLSSVKQSLNDVENSLEQGKEKADMYNGHRARVTSVTLIIPVIFLAAGVLCAIINLRVLVMLLAMLILLVTAFLFIAVAIDHVAAVVSGALCHEVDAVLDGSGTYKSNNGDILSVILNCADGDSPFQDLEDTVNEGLDQAEDSLCQSMQNLCGGDSSCEDGCHDPVSLKTQPISITVNHQTQSMTLEQCKSGYGVCGQSTDAQNTAADALTAIQVYVDYTNTLKDVMNVLDCKFVSGYLDTMRDALCDDVSGGLKSIDVGAGTLCAILLIAVIMYILGAKRFRNKHDPMIKGAYSALPESGGNAGYGPVPGSSPSPYGQQGQQQQQQQQQHRAPPPASYGAASGKGGGVGPSGYPDIGQQRNSGYQAGGPPAGAQYAPTNDLPSYSAVAPKQ